MLLLLPLPKKDTAKKYSDHKTISRKTVAHILSKRLVGKIEELFGFGEGKGTKDAIGLMIKMLKRREECDTNLTHVYIHHCSVENLVKR
jgi:hypothetical protein